MISPGIQRRILLLLTATVITTVALIRLTPRYPLPFPAVGASVAEEPPGLRIRLAAAQTPPSTPAAETGPQASVAAKPEPKAEPKPESKAEPKAEPEPRTEPAPTHTKSNPASTASASDEHRQGTPSSETTREQTHAVPLQTAGKTSVVDDYLSRLVHHISQFYYYPTRARRLGQEGTPEVLFEFRRDGSLLVHSLRKTSGHDQLDQAALDMLARAAPLPAVPDTMTGNSFTYALPVSFRLR